jgi:hypothetical protein
MAPRSLVCTRLARTIHHTPIGHALVLCLSLATAFVPVVSQAQTYPPRHAPPVLQLAQGTGPSPSQFSRKLYTAWSPSYQDTCASVITPHCDGQEKVYTAQTGVLAYIAGHAGPGLVPLYLHRNTADRDTCVSRLPRCTDPNVTLEDGRYTIGYVAERPGAGLSPLYSAWSRQRKDTCVSLQPYCNGQRQLYGERSQILGYVRPFGSPPAALSPTASAAPATAEQQCFDAVQGKVAWNQSGSTSWSPSNVQRLCKGTTNPARTIACFQAQIRMHNDWNRGITACQPAALAAAPSQAAPPPIPPATPVGPAPPAAQFVKRLYTAWSPSLQDTCVSSVSPQCDGQDKLYTEQLGTLGYLAGRPGPGLVPLYIHRNRQATDTCVSRWPRCSDPTITPDDARSIIGYVAYQPGPGLVPLYTAWSPARSDTCVSLRPDCNGLPGLYQARRYLLGYLRALTTPVTPPAAQQPSTGSRPIPLANKPGFQGTVTGKFDVSPVAPGPQSPPPDVADAYPGGQLPPGYSGPPIIVSQPTREPASNLERFGLPNNRALARWLRTVVTRKLQAHRQPAGAAAVHRELGRLTSNPVARWELTPYLLEAGFHALSTRTPSRAQRAFYTAFQQYFSVVEQQIAQEVLRAWEQYKKTDAAKQGHTLSILYYTGASVSGFKPPEAVMRLGPSGRAALDLVYLPATAAITPELAQTDLAKWGGDLLGVFAGLGFAVGAEAVLGAAFGAYLGLGTITNVVSNVVAGEVISHTVTTTLLAKAGGAGGAAAGAGTLVAGLAVVALLLVAGGMKIADFAQTRQFEARLQRAAAAPAPPRDFRTLLTPNKEETEVVKAALLPYLAKMMFADPADQGKLIMALPDGTTYGCKERFGCTQ